MYNINNILKIIRKYFEFREGIYNKKYREQKKCY